MNLRCLNPQFFIASRVGDVALEHDRAHGAGAHDHRLGVVIEAVSVLCARVPADALLPADRAAFERLDALRRPTGPGSTGDTPITTADIDHLIARLVRLRHNDPQAASGIVRRIVEEAGPPAPTATG
jgi:hypothetical protein